MQNVPLIFLFCRHWHLNKKILEADALDVLD
jgi:hypothetical protein